MSDADGTESLATLGALYQVATEFCGRRLFEPFGPAGGDAWSPLPSGVARTRRFELTD
jgi:hypothetical protein